MHFDCSRFVIVNDTDSVSDNDRHSTVSSFSSDKHLLVLIGAPSIAVGMTLFVL